MANFNISIGRSFTPPTVDDNTSILDNKVYTYKLSDFTNNFFDRDGDTLSLIKLVDLVNISGLTYLGEPISPNKTFKPSDIPFIKFRLPENYAIYNGALYQFDEPVNNIILRYENSGYKLTNNVAGKLTFTKGLEIKSVEGTLIPNRALEIEFTVIDSSNKNNESEITIFSLIPQGDVNVVNPYINKPPTVIDFIVSTTHGVEFNFTKDHFLAGYNDVEGDAPKVVQLDNLPTTGKLYIGTEEVVNLQELTIDQLNSLRYVPDSTITTENSITFSYRISDTGSNSFSTWSVVTVNVGAKIANAPVVSDSSMVITGKVTTLNAGLFTKDFTDGDGDSFYQTTIKSLPLIELSLYNLGNLAKRGDVFLTSNASAIKFILPDDYAVYNGVGYRFGQSIDKIIADYAALGYRLTSNSAGIMLFTNQDNPDDVVTYKGAELPARYFEFKFTTSDDSDLHLESNIAIVTLIPQGDINVKAVYTNNPPDIGDNTITIKNTDIRIWTQADFIEDTDPRFTDPEGDAPYQLKVLTLPPYGELQFNNVAVTVNQIVSFADINASKFKYVADSSRRDINNVKFNFAVSDSGSKIFVE